MGAGAPERVATVRFLPALAACLACSAIFLLLSVGQTAGSALVQEHLIAGSSRRLAWEWIFRLLPHARYVAEAAGAWLCLKVILRIPWDSALLVAIVIVLVNSPVGALQQMLFQGTEVPGGESMVPELLGRHVVATCPNCRYAYPLPPPKSRAVPGKTVCPNCGSSFDEPTKPIHRPDVVVLDCLGRPNRWDAVLFQQAVKGPAGTSSQVTIAAHVIGLPGETVELVGGDVFINQGSAQVKPPEAARGMWLAVHDTSCVARAAMAGQRGWEPARADAPWKSHARPIGPSRRQAPERNAHLRRPHQRRAGL